MSHDTEPEDVKLVSIVEREAEEAYPVQYWDGSDIKKTFEADSDDLQEAYMNGRLHPACGEEMADVLICLWLLEHMYDIKGCDNRTRHPSPVGAGAALIKAVSKILRYNTEKERLDGLADAAEDVRRWVMRLEKENGITDEELGEWVERKTVRQQRRNEDAK